MRSSWYRGGWVGPSWRSVISLALVATSTLVATSLGCSACVDDHPTSPGVAAAGPAADPANVELRAHCAAGLVPPAAGFAAITEIPSLGGRLMFVQDINDDGVAVGSGQIAGGKYHAFRYTDVGGIQDLGALAGFGAQSYASAISPDGAIAGHADHGDGTGALFGHRYTASGGRTEVCPTGCSVWDLNGNGQAVGLLLGQDPATWQAFVWSQAGGLHPLGTLGGARSSATGISEKGVVVGNAQLADSASSDVGHAFLYDSRASHPVLQDLNVRARTPGWVLRGANDVNEAFVVGYGTHNQQSRAFRFDLATGEVHDLGSLGGSPSVGWAGDASGDVVGWVAKDDHTNIAFVYGPGLGGLHALGDYVDPALGWELQQANGINSHGTIVGMGIHQGNTVGFKLTLPLCGR
jgi:probable HAF family extracellular repeat protein